MMMKQRGKILVVDDSEDIRFLVSSLLKSIGHEAIEAGDGVTALELLETDPQIRLVITDYDMPRMNGLELTRRIRRNECLEDLPVLMQSASPLELLETRATAAGVTRLLPRTIRPKGLLDEITAILKADEPPHVWRALLVGLPPGSASTLRSTLSDAGFQVLQVPDDDQARAMLQTIDTIDLAFVNTVDPEYGEFVRVHLLRTEKDFCLFRLVLLMRTALAPETFRGGMVGVAGYLMNPISPTKVIALLHRLGLAEIRKGR
jgi:two-component system chemotaxis response regulator CheY